MRQITCSTNGNTDIVNITSQAADLVRDAGLAQGVLCLFVPGATGGLTTLEFEPGVVADFRRCLERLVSEDVEYLHNRNCVTGNGHAHVRAGLLGPSLCVPVADGELVLGTWQQIVFVDFDNRPRQRRIVAQIVTSL